MTDTTAETSIESRTLRARLTVIPSWVWTLIIAGVIYAVIYTMILASNPGLSPRFRVSAEPLINTRPIVQVHVAGAISAFLIGTVLMFGPKGKTYHRTLGWIWVVAMAVTAISSFFITGLMGKWYSPIHALSAWTVLALPFAVAAARRRKIQEHRKAMTGMFFGGIIIAGLFSFLPGRIMWKMLFTI
ncbi:MAG: DUF2306 domain-containing protein [Pseudomonadota bacterium]